MRTIAVVNQKGGCGKTITSINLSAFLAREQRRVLLVDMDPQGHATLGLLTDAAQPSRTMYEVLLPDAGRPPTGLGDVIRPVRENLDVAPSDILLSAIPETLAGRVGREDILSEAMASVEGRYDYVIVDCPPNVGLLTFNTLKACSDAIVPMDPSFFSLHGLGKLLESIEVLAKETDHHISVRTPSLRRGVGASAGRVTQARTHAATTGVDGKSMEDGRQAATRTLPILLRDGCAVTERPDQYQSRAEAVMWRRVSSRNGREGC